MNGASSPSAKIQAARERFERACEACVHWDHGEDPDEEQARDCCWEFLEAKKALRELRVRYSLAGR